MLLPRELCLDDVVMFSPFEQAWSIKDLLYGQKGTPSISFNAPANVSARDFQNQP